MRRQIDDALQGQMAFMDVVQHHQNQGLNGGIPDGVFG
jgi:hypothetical protein